MLLSLCESQIGSNIEEKEKEKEEDKKKKRQQ